MATKGLSIAIGDKIIQICVTNEKKRPDNRVYAAYMISTPDGAVNDGLIVDQAKLSAAILECLNANGIKMKKVTFTLTSGKVAAREVKLPLVRENKIKSIIETNAAEYFPIDMSKYHVSYALLERVEDPAKSICRVMAYAVPLAVLEGYFNLAELLKLEVNAIDYEGNSVYESSKLVNGTEGTTLFVDIGTTSSFVTVMREKILLMSRMFPCGCDDLISAHLATKNSDEADYCKALEEVLSHDSCVRISAADTAEYLSRTIGNIERFEDYFNSTFSETPIENIVITGVCAKAQYLAQLISDAVGITATVAETVEGFTADKKMTQPLPEFRSCFSNILAPIDLVPPQFAKKKKERDPNSLSLSICVLCAGVLIGLAMGTSALLGYWIALGEKKDLENEIKTLESAETLYLKYADYELSANGFDSLKNLTFSNNDALTEFISELEEKMPSDIAVLSANCFETGVNLNIVVTSKESAAMVISQLRSFSTINLVSVSSLTETLSEDTGLAQVYFSASCTYGTNPYYPTENSQNG